jgi:tRNA(adenine34) deaminase
MENQATAAAEEPLRDHDEDCMKVAIAEAGMASQEGKMPFGACLATPDGTIVLRAHNQCSAAPQRGGGGRGDVTRHAEMELIRQMLSVDDLRREDLTMYASTEPCVMCAGAIYWSGVGRLVFGCSAQALEEKLSGPGGFDIAVRKLYSMASPGARTIRIVGPLLEEESLLVHDEAGVWRNSLKKV